jgi:hypothetical protein
MSHFTTYKISNKNLKGITSEMLMAAMQKLAAEFGLKLGTRIKDYYGKSHDVQAALTGNGLRYGIGFSVENGEIKAHGDSYNSPSWSSVSDRATQHLIAQKIAANIRTQHANATIKIQAKDKNVLVEACY